MDIASLYNLFKEHPSVTIDTRTITEGSIFFALKGENFNGNQFAPTALEKGASFAVVEEADCCTDDRIILVDNVLKTLQNLATMHRVACGIPILAITGTNGKTTTKELVSSVLSKKFCVLFTRGNLNNHIGVPLTLLSLRSDHQFGVVEMGANHPGEIDELCRIAQPDFGLITNVGKAHLEGFGSFEGVIRTKTEMYRYLENKKGTIFINSANQTLTGHAGKVKKISYCPVQGGEGLEGEILDVQPYLTVRVLFPKGWLPVRTRLVGSYNLENVLAACAVGLHFGVDPLDIARAIESYQPDNNRSQLMETSSNKLLLDAYNANPSSMQAALVNFKLLKGDKKGVILGDMLELGDTAAEEHQKVVDMLATMPLDKVLLAGPYFSGCSMPGEFAAFSHTDLLREYLISHKLTGYTLLIKGSRGMKMEKIVEEL